MTLLLTNDDVRASVTMADAIEAMEAAFREQGTGGVTQPPRTNIKAGKGWLRVGPVVMEQSGWMGFKAMNLAPGVGVSALRPSEATPGVCSPLGRPPGDVLSISASSPR